MERECIAYFLKITLDSIFRFHISLHHAAHPDMHIEMVKSSHLSLDLHHFAYVCQSAYSDALRTEDCYGWNRSDSENRKLSEIRSSRRPACCSNIRPDYSFLVCWLAVSVSVSEYVYQITRAFPSHISRCGSSMDSKVIFSHLLCTRAACAYCESKTKKVHVTSSLWYAFVWANAGKWKAKENKTFASMQFCAWDLCKCRPEREDLFWISFCFCMHGIAWLRWVIVLLQFEFFSRFFLAATLPVKLNASRSSLLCVKWNHRYRHAQASTRMPSNELMPNAN